MSVQPTSYSNRSTWTRPNPRKHSRWTERDFMSMSVATILTTNRIQKWSIISVRKELNGIELLLWGKLAECHMILPSNTSGNGRQCFIEGSLQTRSWDAERW